jgi:hypothetical protein
MRSRESWVGLVALLGLVIPATPLAAQATRAVLGYVYAATDSSALAGVQGRFMLPALPRAEIQLAFRRSGRAIVLGRNGAGFRSRDG